MKKRYPISLESEATILKRLANLLTEPLDEERGDLSHQVKEFLERKDSFLRLSQRYPTPFYAFDPILLDQQISAFDKAFTSQIPQFRVYYAMKTNYHPFLLNAIL